jgi:ribA/ribD-fused uncharacterized protein
MPKIDCFKGKYEFLSNFYSVEIVIDGITYPSVEHAYVAAKTEDKNIKQKIAEIPTASEAKKFGRKIKLKDNWDNIKILIMLDLLIRKFDNPRLRNMLKNTEGYELVEGNVWHDCFYGACECKNCSDKEKFNVLGRLLMKIRELLLKI